MNPADYLILAGVAILLFFAARYAFRHKGGDCGGDCSACPYGKECSEQKKRRRRKE